MYVDFLFEVFQFFGKKQDTDTDNIKITLHLKKKEKTEKKLICNLRISRNMNIFVEEKINYSVERTSETLIDEFCITFVYFPCCQYSL